MVLLSATRAVLIRSVAMLLALLLPATGSAQGAGWTFDEAYGAASVVALPGGQATLARDGAGAQVRNIDYLPGDGGAPIAVVCAYGPGDRKTIESEAGVTRHHVYGHGPAPIMRTESGGLTYQAGPDTIVIDGSGTATVARRIADLKHSTVAVLDDRGQQAGQRASYDAYGRMQLENAGTDAYTVAALLAGYEGLSAWMLGSDQLLDNRARVYDPASARFLALDGAGQANAYESRSDNPVSRVDPDGNIDFDQLIAALRRDRSIAVGFGDEHDRLEMAHLLLYVTLRLAQEDIPFRIYQEANLLAESPAFLRKANARFRDSTLKGYLAQLLNRGFVTDLSIANSEITGKPAADFKAIYAPRNLPQDYKIFTSNFEIWERTIPVALASSRAANVVPIFFFGANHFPRFESAVHRYPPVVIGGKYKVSEIQGNASLIPLSSYGIQSKYKMVSVLSNRYANAIRKDDAVVSIMDFLTVPGIMLPVPYQVQIPEQAFMAHPALVTSYAGELMSHIAGKLTPVPAAGGNLNGDDEKKEQDEKDEESHANPHRPALRLPPKQGDSVPFLPGPHEK